MRRPFTAMRLGVLIAAAGLVGCAQQPKPLYHWEAYQRQVYEHLKGGSSGPEEQIRVLLAQAEKARSLGSALPPGFRAHLGMLYVQTGRIDGGRQHFEAEKSAFPESTDYMNFLLAKMNGPSTSASAR